MTDPATPHDTAGGQRERLRSLAEAAMPGPWGWRGYIDGSIELRTLHSGGQRLITTMRAEPCIVQLLDESVALTIDACDSCIAEAAKTRDPFIDYRCPKPENLDTVWLHDRESIVVRPANQWAKLEVPYRGDVVAVDQPEAAFIAAVTPDVVLALLDALDADVPGSSAATPTGHDNQ